MLAFSSAILNQFIRFHAVFAASLIAGFIVWAFLSRREPHAPLPLRLRIGLVALLAATPLVWWSTTRSLSERGILKKSSIRLDLETAEAMGLAFPQSVSFATPDLRIVANRNVLMLLPPSRMEWTIDASISAVSLSFGFDPTAYEKGQTDGADLMLELEDPALKRLVFQRHLDPMQKPNDRGDHQEVVVLPPRSRPAKLILRTEAGPAGDAAWDWIYLSHFHFSKNDLHVWQQFPGFNRIPEKIIVDNTGLFQGEDGKTFLFVATPAVFSFVLRDDDHRLQLDYGFMKSAYTNGGQTNGAILQIEFKPRAGKTTVLFEYYAKPVEREADRNFLHASVTLPKHQAGDQVIISLLPGDNNNNSWDHTFIRHLSLD